MIIKNLYHFLGVTSNSRLKDVEKNISKINAFLSIQKQPKLDFDIDILGAPERTTKEVQKTQNLYIDNQIKLFHSLFWFIDNSSIDKIAIEYLKKNDSSKAIEIWEKQVRKSEISLSSFSAYSNLSSLLFYVKNYQRAVDIKLAMLESPFLNNYAELVLGSNHNIPLANVKNIYIKNVVDYLSSKKEDINEILNLFNGSSETVVSLIRESLIGEPIQVIEREIKIAKKSIEEITNQNTETFEVTKENLIRLLGRKVASEISNSKGKVLVEAKATLKIEDIEILIRNDVKELSVEFKHIKGQNAGDVGRTLYKNTKVQLELLKKITSDNNIEFATISDKLAHQLERCGVAYYNSTGNDLDYLDVYEFGLSIAIGESIRKMLKDAVDHSENEKLNDGLDDLITFINRLQKKKSSVLEAKYFLDDCEPILRKMKLNRGENDEFFLNISSNVVKHVMSILIEVENARIKLVNNNPFRSLY